MGLGFGTATALFFGGKCFDGTIFGVPGFHNIFLHFVIFYHSYMYVMINDARYQDSVRYAPWDRQAPRTTTDITTLLQSPGGLFCYGTGRLFRDDQ